MSTKRQASRASAKAAKRTPRKSPRKVSSKKVTSPAPIDAGSRVCGAQIAGHYSCHLAAGHFGRHEATAHDDQVKINWVGTGAAGYTSEAIEA